MRTAIVVREQYQEKGKESNRGIRFLSGSLRLSKSTRLSQSALTVYWRIRPKIMTVCAILFGSQVRTEALAR